MKRRLIQIFAIMVKEMRQIRADRRIIVMLAVAPVIQLVVFAKAVNFEVDNIPTVVVDHDDSEASRRHLRRLLADGTLKEVDRVHDDGVAMRMLDVGDAAAAIVVPADLDRDLTRGDVATIQVMIDGTDPNRAGVAAGTAGRYFGEVALDEARTRMTRQAALAATQGMPIPLVASVQVTPRVYYNPTLETPIYMIPGVAAMLLVIVTTLVTAMGLAREREMGTLEQVLVTPIPSWGLLAGKIAPYTIIGLFDVAVALAVGAWVFDLPLRGSFVLLGFATLLYLLSTLGVGLFVSTVATTQQQAFMGGFLFMLPAILLSGNLTPIASMPDWMQPFTYLNPLRYYIFMLRAVLLRAASWADVWPELLALGTFGVLIFSMAVIRFRTRVA